MPSKKDLKELLSFSQSLAQKSGEVVLKLQEKFKIVKYKDTQDIATSADLASEKLIVSAIQNTYPTHRIFSEEKGWIGNKSDYEWIIDPLDGTKEFARNIPLFNVSIALQFKGKLICSVVFRPSDRSLFSAAYGMGSFLGNSKIVTSKVESIDDSFVYCYIPSYHRQKENYEFAWHALSAVGKKVYRLRGLSDENTALSWLAQGSIEAYLNLGNPPKWHDIASGLLIAKEAGAVITDIYGRPINNNVTNLVVACNAKIHQELLKTING